MIGVIGGSGVYEIEGVVIKKTKKVSTPLGRPSDLYKIGEIKGIKIAFLPRHGSHHDIAPHKINYRANIWGFKELGVDRIISVNSVGGIDLKMKPGDIAVMSQVIDMTEGRQRTFYDKDEIVHVDFTEPYCPELRKAILSSGKRSGIKLHKNATYVCTNGPRLESAGEIRAYSILGADVVGMTGMPEASLARELEICFAGIAVIANHAPGISKNKLTAEDVVRTMKASASKIKLLLKNTFSAVPGKRNCDCKDALKGAKM